MEIKRVTPVHTLSELGHIKSVVTKDINEIQSILKPGSKFPPSDYLTSVTSPCAVTAMQEVKREQRELLL